ncbi:MAG: hypothetical protein M0008_13200 [Actinomycetota bacterium]|jgi:hypothetical protein|nr:hypothetical protein [Actinomycetota bacterium]
MRIVMKKRIIMRNLLKPRTFVVAAVAMLLSGSAYAFTASNTVPTTTAGNGNNTISSYTVSNVSYTLSNSASPGTAASPVITAVSFTLSSPATAANVSAVISAGSTTSPTTPQAEYSTNSSGGTGTGCDNTSSDNWTCYLSSGQTAETVNAATVLTVTAAN